MQIKLEDLGERQAIKSITRLFGNRWPEDDSFYFEDHSRYLLITTDSISKHTHIPEGASPERVGYFLAAVNLSDIAAMGGTPRYFMAAMILPRNTGLDYLERVEKGIARCLRKYKVEMAGGDLKEGPLSMTGVAFGEVAKKSILRRDKVRKGDLVCVTGRLGKNAAGYYMWKKANARGKQRWAELLLDVEPRIKEGRFLSRVGATSAIDLSDGVYSSITQLRSINGCGFEIDLSKLPVDRNAIMVNKKLGVGIEELALKFGGEYELLFTIPRSRYADATRAAMRNGIRITCIGKVSGRNNYLLDNGKKTPITDGGYEHFRKRR